MEQENNLIKAEENQIEDLLEKPFIKQESDMPDYVDINSFTEKNYNPADVEQIFRCPECRIKYKKNEYLSIHAAVHDPNMCCPLCCELFTCKKKLRVHINNHIRSKMNDDKKITYDCTYCLKSFNTKKKYTIHLRVHTNERPYKCEICGEGFKQLGALKVHYVTHTRERKFICELCSGAYTTSSSLKRHKKRIHDRGRTMNCKYCGAKFQNKADFNTHRTNVHPFSGFNRTCPLCFEVFVNKVKYRLHKQLHIDSSPKFKRLFRNYQCLLCGEETNSMKIYVDHIGKHLCYTNTELKKAAKSKSFRCKFCPSVYKSKRCLFQHMDVHVVKTLKCDLCQSHFTYMRMKTHKRRVHQVLDCRVCHKIIVGRSKMYNHYKKHNSLSKNYQCNTCGKKYVTKALLKYHYRMKHQVNLVKNFKCGMCGKCYLSQYAMLRHKMKTHSSKVKFKCPKCKLNFGTLKEIRRHNLTHQNIMKNDKVFSCVRQKSKVKVLKQFRCKVCKKIFLCFRNYKLHMSLKTCVNFYITQSRLLTCEFCEKNFMTVSRLKRHSQLHSDYDYQCQFCDKKSKMIETIQRHTRVCHPDKKVYWCQSCGEGFNELSNYETHSTLHTMKVEGEESFVEGNCSEMKCEVKNEI